MEKNYIVSSSRGKSDYGWLKTFYTYSFANYYDPKRMGFGKLRVVNDDTIAAGRGFGQHPHDNMEIVTIPLAGELAHQDSMGNKTVIKAGEVQAMSAGTGVLHSEMNFSPDKPVKLFQIWLETRDNETEIMAGQTIAIPKKCYMVLG